MIESVALLSVSPGMLIDCLPSLLVVERMEYHSGSHAPGLATVSVASLVVGCIGWLLGTPGMMFDKYELVLG